MSQRSRDATGPIAPQWEFLGLPSNDADGPQEKNGGKALNTGELGLCLFIFRKAGSFSREWVYLLSWEGKRPSALRQFVSVLGMVLATSYWFLHLCVLFSLLNNKPKINLVSKTL